MEKKAIMPIGGGGMISVGLGFLFQITNNSDYVASLKWSGILFIFCFCISFLIVFGIGAVIIGIFDWLKIYAFKGIPVTDRQKKRYLKAPKPDWQDYRDFSEEDFVEAMYNRILCRESDIPGFRNYVRQLREGTLKNKGHLINVFWNAPERINKEKDFGIKVKR